MSTLKNVKRMAITPSFVVGTRVVVAHLPDILLQNKKQLPHGIEDMWERMSRNETSHIRQG